MPSKTTKRARKAAQSNIPVEKDDGSRWRVRYTHSPAVPSWMWGFFAYSGTGVPKREAQRLAAGLVVPSEPVRVKL